MGDVMKRFIALTLALLVCVSFSGCIYKRLPSNQNNNVNGNVAGDLNSSSNLETVEEFDYAGVTVSMTTSYNEDTYKETATIFAQDKEGNTLWSRETGSYEVAQLDSFNELGKKDKSYYYTEGGTLVSLDLETGVVNWKNSDFGGYSIQYVFGENSIYMCGFFGPDFYEVSYDGSTVKRIETIDENYWDTSKIKDMGDKIAVTFEMSEDGNGGTFYIDKQTYAISK